MALKAVVDVDCQHVNYAVDDVFKNLVEETFPVLHSYCDPCQATYLGDKSARLELCVGLLGCTDPVAYNYNASTPLDDGTCSYNPCKAGADSCDRDTQLCTHESALPNQFACDCKPGFVLVGEVCSANGCSGVVAPTHGSRGSCPQSGTGRRALSSATRVTRS